MHICSHFCPLPPSAPSFSCPSLLSFMFLFFKHLQWKFPATLWDTSALQCQGKSSGWRRDVLGKEMQKDKMRISKSDLSFTKITDAWVTRKHHFTHHLVYYTAFLYIYFLDFDRKKNAHLNVQKPNTNITICTSKCCHSEITERVIHPRLHPCLWASLLLMASSFFLCSLYFPSDSGACFIVFCHVSVIAPTACLMLSI